MSVDMSKAKIVRMGKTLETTIDMMRLQAKALAVWVILYAVGKDTKLGKGLAYPILECSPQGDLGEVKTPTLRVGVSELVRENYFSLVAKASTSPARGQDRRRLAAYNTLGVMVDASRAMLKAAGQLS